MSFSGKENSIINLDDHDDRSHSNEYSACKRQRLINVDISSKRSDESPVSDKIHAVTKDLGTHKDHTNATDDNASKNQRLVTISKRSDADEHSVSKTPQPSVKLRANDHIEILTYFKNSMIEDSVDLDVFSCRPLFTHQLFNEEVMEIPPVSDSTSEGDNSAIVSIQIHIRLINMHFVVRMQLPPSLSEMEQLALKERLARNLSAGLPLQTRISLGSTNQSEISFPTIHETSFISIGKEIHNFVHKGAGMVVKLVSAKDEGAAELLSRCERLAMWFIETASTVDFSDPRWEAIFLFDQYSGSVLGYMTLFTFFNPSHGSRIRVCQAMIVPHLQKQGLGKEMMRVVYKLALEREAVSEITVEDPCEGFQVMRNQVDFERFLSDFLPSNLAAISDQSEPDISKALKINKQQAKFVREAYEYFQLVQKISSDSKVECLACSERSAALEAATELCDAAEDHEMFASYRLKLKRAFIKADKELTLMSKTEMQKELVQLFNERIDSFLAVLGIAVKLRLLSPISSHSS